MKLRSIWTILTILPKLLLISGEDTSQTLARPAFLPNCSNFEEVVKCSGFVDKTLFIEAFFNFHSNNHHLITRPRKFGKSTNMDMLRRFVQLEVDQDGQVVNKLQTYAYRYFTNKSLNFRIASYDKIITDHLAQYPVIHIEFKGIMRNSYKDTLDNIRDRVRNSCLPYEWLIGILQKRYAKTKDPNVAQQVRFLKKVIYDVANLPAHIVQKSLSLLAKILLNYFRRELFVFIDDYDVAVDYGIRYAHRIKYDPSEIRNFSRTMMENLFDAALPHIKYIMMTGLARGLPYVFNDYDICLEHHKFLHSFEMATFFGFTEDQVVQLLQSHRIDEKQKKNLMEYYNGYLNPEWGVKLYNPHGVLGYLASYESGKVSYPLSWIDRGSLDFIIEAFRNPRIYLSWLQMLVAKVGIFIVQTYASEENLIQLIAQFNKKAALESSQVAVFYWYCMENGYIARTDSGIINQRFPNKEIKIEITKILFRFYRKHVGEIADPLSDTITRLTKYEDVNDEVFNLRHGLEKLVNSEFNYKGCDCENMHFFALIYYSVRLRFKNVFTDVKKVDEDTAYYIVVNEPASSTVIAVKYRSTVKKALRQALQFETNEFFIQKSKIIRYIGIRINVENGLVNVAYFSPDDGIRTHYAIGDEEEEDDEESCSYVEKNSDSDSYYDESYQSS